MATKDIHASINTRMQMSATLSGEQVRTGRKVVADKFYGRVCAWAANPTVSDPKLQEDFLSSLAGVPTIALDKRSCYRGRHSLETDNPHRLDFGPPPTDAPRANRYNAEGRKVLYLCDSLQGVARELEDEEDVWAQEYSLPQDLRIANFRVDDENDLLSKVFWITENAEEEENGYPYRFGQYIAELVASQFDGMAVPGVRGDQSKRYFNIIVLRNIYEWMNWVPSGSSPVRIR